MNKMKSVISFLLVTILLASTHATFATRPKPLSSPKTKPPKQNNNKGGRDNGMDGLFGSGSGFGIPGFGRGWGNIGGGYGAGFGGPSGGYSEGGVIKPTVVCKDKGPCYKKKLTCPAKCFTSYSRSGKGYGGGGGGGGCTIDCKKKCIAYC